MKVKLLEPIEGYEDVAEYKYPTNGQPVLREHGSVDVFDRVIHSFCCCLVLTPIKRWRPATIDDAIKAIEGKDVVARFKERSHDKWINEGMLKGVMVRHKSGFIWYSMTRGWDCCEVLDA